LSLVTRPSPLVLFFASANPGKLREFQTAARPHGIEIQVLPRFCQLEACIEDGATFEENARKKALHYSMYSPGMVFADDSGILVDALGGAPGVFSARFAGPNATDDENNQKLLAELRRLEVRPPGSGLTPDSLQRAAHYVCVLALARQGTILTVVEGRADGLIIDAPRGSGGFGYDPYFLFPPLGRTFAELTPDQKFAVSHRGEAFRKLLAHLTW
jgi:XTP/dITP diphosphohydrolase